MGSGYQCLMSVSAIFQNILASVLLEKKIRVHGENHQSVVCHWQTTKSSGIEYTSSLAGIKCTTCMVMSSTEWVYVNTSAIWLFHTIY
jgi:hypothetical protein